ncbi:MAG TPA: rRNA adenine N-6-methyltransferase family protein [Thermoanaerobaculia bacterium]|nr:rRNA adenine N-6-methyltransferase family protein [Thermoanaerobaculia bacterium]
MERLSDMLCHVAEYARHPRSIGAIIPSSRALARTMTESIPRLGERDVIVELGPGTGAITRAIVNAYPRNRVIAVEKNARLAAMLRERFPRVDVAETCVSTIASDLQIPRGHRIGAVLSSLPMLSFDDALRRRVLDAIRGVLDDRAVYVQFTYSRAAWEGFAPEGLRLVGARRVIRNVPPATILSFVRGTSLAS